MDEKKSFGIQESKQLVDFMVNLVSTMKDHKKDDGVIDTSEIISAIGSEAESAMKAALGSWHIPKELADLDAEEKEIMLSKLLDLVVGMSELFLNIEITRDVA